MSILGTRVVPTEDRVLVTRALQEAAQPDPEESQ